MYLCHRTDLLANYIQERINTIQAFMTAQDVPDRVTD